MEKWMEAPIELLGQKVPMTTKFVVLIICVIYEKYYILCEHLAACLDQMLEVAKYIVQ